MWRICGAAVVAASRNPSSRHRTACHVRRPIYRQASHTTAPSTTTSGIETVTSSPPLEIHGNVFQWSPVPVPSPTAQPAGTASALPAEPRIALSYRAAFAAAAIDVGRRNAHYPIHLLV